LQAVYTDNNGNYKSYCYGTFASDGKPNQITQMIINKVSGDTSVNIFYDDSMRVKTLFITVAGVKSNSLLSFDYSLNNKVILSSYYFDFTSDSSKLTDQLIYSYLGNGTYSLDGHTSFRMSQNFLSNNTMLKLSGTSSDPFITKFVSANAAIPVLNAIIVTGTTAIGCLLGRFPGCVVGGIIGTYMATGPASANASVISTPQSSTPSSPNSQTSSTQLQTKRIFIGTTLNSGVVNFTGFCNYSVEYINTSFELKLDNTQQNILSANVFSTMVENIVGSCSQTQPAPSNRHSYFLNSSSISGNSITINFGQDASSFPQNNASFSGTKNGSTISGTLTLNRISNGLTCLVTIPVSVIQIN